MNREEFKKLIESIGFEYNRLYYFHNYDEYRIDLYDYHYYFDNGSGWIDYEHYLNDLTPIQEHFKKELRSIKLKGLLG